MPISRLHVEQELLTLLEHMSSPPVFSGVRVARSLDLCVFFVDRCLSFCTFSFGHCFLFSSSIYGLWLLLWYLQNLLVVVFLTFLFFFFIFYFFLVVSCFVCVCVCVFACIVFLFCYWILELFRQCGIFLFSCFLYIYCVTLGTTKIYLKYCWKWR